MSLLDPTPPPAPVSPAKAIAAHLLASSRSEYLRRCENHAALYKAVWDSPVPPAEIIAEMGSEAAQFLGFAGRNIEQLAQLAADGGKQLSDFLPDSLWVPRLPLTPNDDGTVTVGSADGLDAWGRPIPEPEQPEEPITPTEP